MTIPQSRPQNILHMIQIIKALKQIGENTLYKL